MPGLVTGGSPIVEPDETYAAALGNLAPSREDAFGALWQEGPTGMLVRAANRGLNPGASDLDQAATRFFDPFGQWNEDALQARKTTTLSIAEANQKYAPPGTTITDKPISEPLAAILGAQKLEQLHREDVLTRYQSNASWPEQLGMGIAASLLDPINLATAFIPGVGEESILGQIGFRGVEAAAVPFGARAVARVGAGFTAGVASQAPVVALKYGLSQEEHDDYTLMSAFGDMATAGGLNAAFHGVGGALGDLLKARTRPEVVEAPFQARRAAMSSSVAQLVDGREVDTTPIFGEAREQPQVVEQAARTIAPQTFERLDALDKERAEIAEQLNAVAAGTPEAQVLTAKLQETNEQTLDLTREAADALQRARGVPPSIPDLAAEQAELYKNGFAQGIPQTEFDQANADIYGVKEEEGAKPKQPTPEQPGAISEQAGPKTPAQARLADLETQWAAQEEHTPLTPAERDELDISKRGVAQAQSRADALDQAATCLKEAGL